MTPATTDTHLPPPPSGWVASTPGETDVADLTGLRRAHESAVRGFAGTTADDVRVEVVGRGAPTRRHVVLRDPAGAVRAWGVVHDRAAGRTLVGVLVDVALATADATPVAAWLHAWAAREGARIGARRGLASTQLDSGADAEDPRQRGWLQDAGFAPVRTWWQMRRPVLEQEGHEGHLPPPRPGVTVRRVARGEDGLPDEQDLRVVHDVLEEAFDDHFNSHTETFDEFVSRLREDPGHRWDHWWLAELRDDAAPVPVGALVSSAAASPDGGPGTSYVDYLGVLAAARGRGVGAALLSAVIGDAARRGRTAVGLEVDADSPTGADQVYLRRGFATRYVTQSWHRDVPAG